MPDRKRIDALDFLRCFAVLCVIGCHYGVAMGRWPTSAIGLLATDGRLGVGIFFVVSGFLIAALLVEERERTGSISLRRFYLRRSLKIVPPLLIFCAVVAVARLLLPDGCTAYDLSSAPLLLKGFSKTDAADWWRRCPQNAHTWSLSVEELFYLGIAPLLAYFGKRSATLGLLGALFLAVLVRGLNLHPNFRMGLPLIPVIEDLSQPAIGALGAMWLLPWATRARPPAIRAMLGSAMLVTGLALPYLNRFVNWYAYFPHGESTVVSEVVDGLAVLLVILSLVGFSSAVGRAVTSFRPFVFLGRISYSLYLWQQFFTVTGYGLGNKPWFTRLPQSPLLLLAMAIVSYFVIEKPARALALKLTRNDRKRIDEPVTLARAS